MRSLPSALLSWRRGSCPLWKASEGDCPCARREGRQKRRHGNARSGPQDMENSIGCSAGWRGRETPEGSEGEKQHCTHRLAVPGPHRDSVPGHLARDPAAQQRTRLLRNWWGRPHRGTPGWSQLSWDLLSPQGLLQPVASCPVRKEARHRGWPQGCGEVPLGAVFAFHSSAWLPQPLF